MRLHWKSIESLLCLYQTEPGSWFGIVRRTCVLNPPFHSQINRQFSAVELINLTPPLYFRYSPLKCFSRQLKWNFNHPSMKIWNLNNPNDQIINDLSWKKLLPRKISLVRLWACQISASRTMNSPQIKL